MLKRIVSDGGTPLKLCALAACDSLDMLYHGIYDASLINALRTSVFLGIVADATSKTVESIKEEQK